MLRLLNPKVKRERDGWMDSIWKKKKELLRNKINPKLNRID